MTGTEEAAKQLLTFGITSDDLAWVVKEIAAGRLTHTQGKHLLKEVMSENHKVLAPLKQAAN